MRSGLLTRTSRSPTSISTAGDFEPLATPRVHHRTRSSDPMPAAQVAWNGTEHAALGGVMLADYTPVANIATSDLAKARSFYEGVLGLKVTAEMAEGGVVIYSAGSGSLLLYVSQFAGTNKATSVGFQLPLDAFDNEVATLREGGVTFETFEAPGLTWNGDVAVSGGGQGKAAWFKDFDGNTIGITAGEMG